MSEVARPLWVHTDSRGYARAYAEALARAKIWNWSASVRSVVSSGTPTADLRMLMVATSTFSDWLRSPWSVKLAGERITIGDTETPYCDRDHEALARMLEGTWVALARDRSNLPPPRFLWARTKDDGPPERIEQSAGGWPLVVAAIGIAGVLANAAVVVYLGQVALDVWRYKVANDAQTQQLLGTQAQALELVEKHATAEQQAGKALPLPDVIRETLDRLKRAQDEILKRPIEPPTKPTMPGFLNMNLNAVFIAGLAIFGGMFLLSHPRKG